MFMFISFYTPNLFSQVGETIKGRGSGSSVSFSQEKEMNNRAVLLSFHLVFFSCSSFATSLTPTPPPAPPPGPGSFLTYIPRRQERQRSGLLRLLL